MTHSLFIFRPALLFVGLFLLTTSLIAQTTIKEEADLIKEIWGKEKKALVDAYMEFSPAEADAFWPVYEEYSQKSRELTAERIRVLNHYGNNYGKFTGEDADLMVKTVLDNQAAVAKLQKKYYKKFKKAVDPVRAAQFLQMERYLQSSVWQAINNNIPFIGELEKSRM